MTSAEASDLFGRTEHRRTQLRLMLNLLLSAREAAMGAELRAKGSDNHFPLRRIDVETISLLHAETLPILPGKLGDDLTKFRAAADAFNFQVERLQFLLPRSDVFLPDHELRALVAGTLGSLPSHISSIVEHHLWPGISDLLGSQRPELATDYDIRSRGY